MNKSIILILIIILSVLLRLYNLGQNPPSLYWDEASLGYNAYSILKSGFDEHGEKFPLARFIAFGDYKPPGYIYATVPAVALFGLNEFAIRFPSGMAGILMVFLSYHLAKQLLKKEKIALLTSLFMAVSPWSLHLSRGAFEANLAAMFNITGLLFFLKSRRNGIYIVVSVIFFLCAFYTFNSNRIISPIIFIVLNLVFIKEQIKNIKWHLVALFITFLLLIPSFSFLKSSESRLRFQEVSIFTNPLPVLLSNQRINLDNGSVLSKIIHNRRLLYLSDYLNHFADNFSGRFLFTHGDVNPRLHVGGLGQLYFFDLPFVALGFLYLLLRPGKPSLVIILWMLCSVVPAAVARETPHALRIVSILPSFQLITALGLNQFLLWCKNKFSVRVFISVFLLFTFVFLLNVYYYFHIYHVHFPVKNSGEFQFGTKEMVEFVNSQKQFYDRIFITPEIGRPYIFFAFYTPIEPKTFQIDKSSSSDIYGFWDVASLGKIDFSLKEVTKYPGSALVVTKDKNLPGSYRLLKIIYTLEGAPLFFIGAKK